MFWIVESGDHARLCRAVEAAGGQVLAVAETLIGEGPDCWYLYQQLVLADRSPVDPGDSATDVAFGNMPERRVIARQASSSEAKRFLKERGVKRLTLPLPGPVAGLDCYRTWGGGYAAWVDDRLIDHISG